MLRGTSFRRSGFTPPKIAAHAAFTGLFSVRRLYCAKAVGKEVEELAEGSELFRQHAGALKIGFRHFARGDSFSAASILYPAVEGILRRHYASRNSQNYPRQARLIEDAKRAGRTGRHAYCLLLIERFDAYLCQVIFADFDWKNPSGVTRHTIGHGVVEPDQCDEICVARVVLTIHHLLFSLSPPVSDPSNLMPTEGVPFTDVPSFPV